MSFIIVAARQRRTCLVASSFLASSFLVPILSLSISAANAQQSASPDLLPPIEVSPPKNADGTAPAADRTPTSRRVAPAPAQQTSANAPQPGTPDAAAPVVVSPTGTVTPTGQVASSLTVITAQDIETQQFRSVPEALSTVPGLNVIQSGGPGGQTSVFMRGTNSNHTKVLIDGIDVGDPSNSNGAFDYAHLLTSDIEQIEVLRGPQSGLYGSDAIGGVISIITRKGDGPRLRPARSAPSTRPSASAVRKTTSTMLSMSLICTPAMFPSRPCSCFRPGSERSGIIMTT
jgi:vitamin B12 transporter